MFLSDGSAQADPENKANTKTQMKVAMACGIVVSFFKTFSIPFFVGGVAKPKQLVEGT
jgi:hypothetical protein